MDICHSRDEVTLIFNLFFRAPILKWMPPIHYPLTMDNTSLYPKPCSCNVTSIDHSQFTAKYLVSVSLTPFSNEQTEMSKCWCQILRMTVAGIPSQFHNVQSILMTIIHDNRGIRGIWAGIPLILRHVATDTKVQGGADTDNHRWIEFLKYCRKRTWHT